MSKEKKGYGKFIVGACLGAGLGLLFAPKKGKDLRHDLKIKLEELLNKAKDIDMEDVKSEFDKKVENIKKELEDLDKEKVLKLAEKKAKQLKNNVEDLVQLAIDKGTPVLEGIAREVREKAIIVTRDVLNKLEEEK